MLQPGDELIVNDFEVDTGVGRSPYLLAINELEQARWSGRAIDGLHDELASIDPSDEARLVTFYGRLLHLPAPADHFEASDRVSVVAALPEADAPRPLDDADFARRVHGAWSGRVIGNMFGKPVEVG